MQYKALLEGLEAVDMKLSEVRIENENFRFDSEYFLKKYINAYKSIKLKAYDRFSAIIDILTDYHANGSYANLNHNINILDYPEYAYMVRSTDLDKADFTNDVKYVNQHAYNYLTKSKLYGGELLINKIGNPGQVYLAPKLQKPMTLGMNLFLIRVAPNAKYTYQFIWAFFNTNIGRAVIYRKINGTAPFTIDKKSILSLSIPKLSFAFQNQISNLVNDSHDKLFDSKTLYVEAEQLLLEELGLVDFKLSTENIAIKRLSESFGTTGRLDAEYYQPKYEEIENKIKSYKGGYDCINSLFSLSKKGLKVNENQFYEYVEIGSINTNDGTISAQLVQGLDLPANAKRLLHKGQILISKVRTYRGGVSIVDKDGYIGSGAFAVLEEKNTSKINKETLFIYLKSYLFLTWSLKPNTGTSYPVILDEDICNFIIPIIPLTIQKQIEEKIQESFALRKKSQSLLATAKRAVEMAIEQDEETALVYVEAESF